MIGAMINIHTLLKASPPCNTAGAKLLAGLTLVPVNGNPNKWTNTKVKPITIPVACPFSFLSVTPKIVVVKINVRITSTSKAAQTVVSPTRPFAPRALKLPRSNASNKEPTNAPTTCAMI